MFLKTLLFIVTIVIVSLFFISRENTVRKANRIVVSKNNTKFHQKIEDEVMAKSSLLKKERFQDSQEDKIVENNLQNIDEINFEVSENGILLSKLESHIIEKFKSSSKNSEILDNINDINENYAEELNSTNNKLEKVNLLEAEENIINRFNNNQVVSKVLDSMQNIKENPSEDEYEVYDNHEEINLDEAEKNIIKGNF